MKASTLGWTIGSDSIIPSTVIMLRAGISLRRDIDVLRLSVRKELVSRFEHSTLFLAKHL